MIIGFIVWYTLCTKYLYSIKECRMDAWKYNISKNPCDMFRCDPIMSYESMPRTRSLIIEVMMTSQMQPTRLMRFILHRPLISLRFLNFSTILMTLKRAHQYGWSILHQKVNVCSSQRMAFCRPQKLEIIPKEDTKFKLLTNYPQVIKVLKDQWAKERKRERRYICPDWAEALHADITLGSLKLKRPNSNVQDHSS